MKVENMSNKIIALKNNHILNFLSFLKFLDYFELIFLFEDSFWIK
jgi:hypothetical protein